MEIVNKPLKQIHQEIREAIKAKLTEAADLTEIKRIVYGEKIRIGTLQTPAIWIIPEPYTPQTTGGKSTDHMIRFDFVVLIKDPDPEKSLQDAGDLSMTIYDVLMADRTLGNLVFDIVPAQIDPAYEMGQATQICYAAVTLDFKIKRRE